jgi:squalene-hopene/tetraprenyl-beta-curcumene cyclase
MSARLLSHLVIPAFCLVAIDGTPARCDEPAQKAPAEAVAAHQARRVIERGLVFLEKDAQVWRNEHQCSTCHHGTMTVWALSEAKRQGYTVKPETLADMAAWTKERLKDIDKPRDTRPGWRMVSTVALYLANMDLAVPGQEAVSADELRRIGAHLVRHQEADGSWAWSSAPPGNRPPPHFESDEVATLLGYMALEPQVPADSKSPSEARESRERAAAWLEKAERTDTTQAAGLRLLVKVRAGESPDVLRPEVARFLGRQNHDGGWGQLHNLPSDAYATGHALYVLSQAGVPPERAEIRRGVEFLVTRQRPDGSWPMEPRAHPGAKPATNVVPITYFGSAWATLGLLRSVSPPVITGAVAGRPDGQRKH